MKWLKNFGMSLLLFSLILTANSRTVSAAEEEYTYIVRLYAGNLGTVTGKGISVNSGSASISSKGDYIEISGLKYGDMVYITPQEAVNVTDERYYVRGVRRSGRDNAEAESPAFYVACDRDYVVAYGVRGDMVGYTVNYQDESGNTLMKSESYYGNAGEKQYVSARYIEGYQPKSLNMVKTLSSNAAENIFTFQYVKVTAPETQTETPGGTSTAPQTATTGTTTTGTTTGGAAAAGNDTDNADDTDDADANAEGEEAGDAQEENGNETPIGGDAEVQLPDDGVPLDQQKLENLDDEETPLADIKLEQGKVMGYMPVYIGIGAAAAAVLAVTAVYLWRRRKKAAGRKESS